MDGAGDTGDDGVGASSDGVTDDDRNRFGLLLDRAAERGLLTPAEYELRLAAMAEATSLDELRRLVTELPAFGGPSPVASRPTGSGGGGGVVPDPASWVLPAPTPARRPGRRSRSPWLLPLLLGVILVVSLVALALVAHSVARNRPAPAPGAVTAWLSPARS